MLPGVFSIKIIYAPSDDGAGDVLETPCIYILVLLVLIPNMIIHLLHTLSLETTSM